MLKRTEKETIVSDLNQKILSSKAIFLTNLVGIPANNANALRKKVREAGGTVVITRNTLFRRAAKGTYCEELLGAALKGPQAIAFAFEEAPAVAKVIFESSKDMELVKPKGGYLGTQKLSAKDVEALAKLPSREAMLGTLLATMQAPVSAFARCLDQIREKKEKGELVA